MNDFMIDIEDNVDHAFTCYLIFLAGLMLV